MKKRFIFFTLLLLTLIGGAKFNVLNAQETITIGSGDAAPSYYIPSQFWYKYSLTQQIYTSEQLGFGKGVISDIAFFRTDNNVDRARNFDVYMVNTSKASFTVGDWVTVTEADKVFSGSITFKGQSWNVIDIEDFEYNGENILICIDDNTGVDFGNTPFKENTTSDHTTLYYCSDNNNPSPASLPSQGSNCMKKNNQIMFTFTPSAPAEPSLTVSEESIALGDVRMGNYWTEKPVTATVEVAYENTVAPTVTSNNEFFTVSYDASSSPFNLTIGYDKTKTSSTSGTITITSGELVETIAVTANPYTPAQGDVWENPITVNFDANNSFTAQATGMYDDYILPGEAEDGNLNDAVYKFTLANDAVVTANVNGTNAIAAIYKAEDLQGNGPSSDNNNTGVQNGPTGPTTFFFDFNDNSLEAFNLIDANNDGKNWEITKQYGTDNYYVMSYSYQSSAITPDNYIVTKEAYVITAASKLTYKVNAVKPYPDHYAVVVSEDGVNFEIVFEEDYALSEQANKEVDLSAYAGKGLYIGFRHYNCTNQYYVCIDNLALTDGSAKSRAGEAQIDGVQYPAGTYYLVAAAEGDFTLNLSTASLPAPEQFAYTAPENNTIVEETNPELSWESAKYASSYDVYLGTTKVAEDITATSFQTTGLSNNTKYNWQVVAKNSIGEFKGEVYSFVTPLDIPQNVTASSNEIYPDNNNVTIEWNAITGVKGYNVYVKVNGEGDGIKHNGNELVTTNSYELSNMDYSLNGHVVYVTAVYEIEGGTYESNMSAAQTIKVTGYGEIYGTITDAANNKGIDGVTVTVTGTDEFGKAAEYTATTNGNGEYSFENVLVGTYSLTASKLDYQAITNPGVEVDTNGEIEISFSLESNPSAPFAVSAEEGRARWDAEYASYNVYRRDSEGLVKPLATEVKAEEYQDAEWETLADGEYEYGVSAMMVETNNITESFNTYSIPEGWTQNGEFEWSFNGTYAYLFQSWSSTTPNNLITPLIDLSNVSAPTISFKYSIGGSWTSSGYYNTLKVEVSESLNGPWTNIFTSSSYTSGFVNVEKSLSAFAGKKVYVKFVTDTDFSTTYIDDVVLPNTTSSESRINWSAPVEKGGITFTGEGNWNTAANWNTVPTSTDKVTINGNATITEDVTVGSIRIAKDATLTVKSGVVLNVTNGISNTNAAALVMEDGAQIIQTNSNVAATFNMNIVNPQNGWGAEQKDGWQFIASPLLNAKTSAFETSGENNDFDLYKYDGTKEGAEWVNYKDHQLEGDNFFYDFSNGMQGWTTINANADSYTWGHTEDGTGKNFTYGAPNGYNGEKGCLFSDAAWYNSSWQAQYNNPNDYVVSPERVMIVKDSKLSFYIQSASYSYSNGEITVLVSESENASADSFVQIHSVNYSDKEWLQVTISLAEYAGKEVWIAIRHKINNAINSYILIDNLELTDGKTRSRSKELFETEFVNGRAYLASYQAETTATFTGVLNNATSFSEEFSYNAANNGDNLANFHLLGNPFSFDMDMSKASFYNMVNGIAVVTSEGGYDYTQTTVPVGNGFFVQAIEDGASFSYTHNARSSQEKANSINVIASGKAGKDNVVVNFAGQAQGFNKLQNFNDAIATVYVSENGKNYGIANVDENTTEVALNFDAKEMGNYTISLDVNGEFETVTLVDRFTGVETNMLLEDEYTFTATGNDNVNRFVIRLANGQEPTANSQFVYQSGEELILSIEGSVQIVDMLGRVVYSNEHANGNNRINVAEFNDATYVVRVVNEEGVKVQKIIL